MKCNLPSIGDEVVASGDSRERTCFPGMDLLRGCDGGGPGNDQLLNFHIGSCADVGKQNVVRAISMSLWFPRKFWIFQKHWHVFCAAVSRCVESTDFWHPVL